MRRPPPFVFPRDLDQLLAPSLTPWQTTVRIRAHRFALALICAALVAMVIAQWRALHDLQRSLEALREALRFCR